VPCAHSSAPIDRQQVSCALCARRARVDRHTPGWGCVSGGRSSCESTTLASLPRWLIPMGAPRLGADCRRRICRERAAGRAGMVYGQTTTRATRRPTTSRSPCPKGSPRSRTVGWFPIEHTKARRLGAGGRIRRWPRTSPRRPTACSSCGRATPVVCRFTMRWTPWRYLMVPSIAVLERWGSRRSRAGGRLRAGIAVQVAVRRHPGRIDGRPRDLAPVVRKRRRADGLGRHLAQRRLRQVLGVDLQ
jgi:hypothetical protein